MKTIIYFSASWCQTCEEFNPIVEEVAQDSGVEFFQVDVEEDPKAAEKHKINVIPCILILEEDKVFKKLVGKKKKEDLLELVA